MWVIAAYNFHTKTLKNAKEAMIDERVSQRIDDSKQFTVSRWCLEEGDRVPYRKAFNVVELVGKMENGDKLEITLRTFFVENGLKKNIFVILNERLVEVGEKVQQDTPLCYFATCTGPRWRQAKMRHIARKVGREKGILV